MPQLITVLTVADLHRSEELYDLLTVTVKRHRPDIVALLGDFLDATGEQKGKLTTSECAQFLSILSCPEVVLIRGNHEGADLWPFVEEWRLSGRELHLLETRTFTYGPLVIVGFPSLVGYSDALTGGFPADPDRWLPHLIKPFGPAGRALWLMHEPPYSAPLIGAVGALAGNLGWMECVERFSPWLVMHGHDHLTSQGSTQWHRRLPCGTVCVNVGQTPSGPLHYCIVKMEFSQPCPSLPNAIQVTAYPWRESIELPQR